MIEPDLPTLLKLCWLITQQWKAELAYSRAQYRVSYYRKLKTKLEVSKKTNEKWNDHLELAKKIELERLNALKKQKNLLDTKKRLRKPISAAKIKLNVQIKIENSKIIGINLPHLQPKMWRFIDATQVAEYADQHEAETALTRILTSKGNETS